MLCENFKEKNKNSIHSELPKINMLPKKHSLILKGLRIKIHLRSLKESYNISMIRKKNVQHESMLYKYSVGVTILITIFYM